mmetsp:Transcript_14241/g.33573  ORF Transcript_14241/g.33573 Transcript_14241/m.33573 type:complete len:234 (-) Transcript_14241:190-891(-)
MRGLGPVDRQGVGVGVGVGRQGVGVHRQGGGVGVGVGAGVADVGVGVGVSVGSGFGLRFGLGSGYGLVLGVGVGVVFGLAGLRLVLGPVLDLLLDLVLGLLLDVLLDLVLDLVVGLVVSLVLGLLLGGGWARVGAGRAERDSLGHEGWVTTRRGAARGLMVNRRRQAGRHAGALHGLHGLDAVDAAQGELQLRLHVRLCLCHGGCHADQRRALQRRDVEAAGRAALQAALQRL